MRCLPSIGLLLLLAGPAAGAVYYVDAAGSDTSPYDTWAKAAHRPSAAVAVGNEDAGGDGPHTLYVGPGTYEDTLSITDQDWEGGRILGTAVWGSTVPAAMGQVNIVPRDADALRVGVANLTMCHLSASAPGDGQCALSVSGTGFTGHDLLLYDAGRYLVFLQSSAARARLWRCLLQGTKTDIACFGSASGACELNYCIIRNSVTNGIGSVSQAIYHAGSGSLTLNNCEILESRGVAVVCNSATGGRLALNNCLVAPRADIPGYWAVRRVAGTMTVTHCALMGWHSYIRNGMIEERGNLDNPRLGFQRYSRTAIIVPCVDDTESSAYAVELADILSARGLTGTFYVCNAKSTTEPYYTLIRKLRDGGVMEIQPHGRSHSRLTYSGRVFTITKAGETITVDRARDLITLSGAGSVLAFRTKTLHTIRRELALLGATVSDLASMDMTPEALGEILADSAGAQPSPYALQVLADDTGATGLYYSEITHAIADLKTDFGTVATSFAPPFGSTNKTVASLVGANTALCRAGPQNAYRLNPIDLWNVRYFTLSSITGADEQQTRANTRVFCHYLSQIGGIAPLLAHNVGEATMAEWGMVLDTIRDEYPQLLVTNMSTAIALITSSGLWSTADGGRTYTRVWDDSTADYHLNPTSDLIGGGIDLGDEYELDYDGNKQAVGLKWDIGAYTFTGYRLRNAIP